jgi:hypothetical protein
MANIFRNRAFRFLVAGIIAIPLVLQQIGCSFLIGEDTQMVNISSNEPDAKFFINGDPYDENPLQVELTKDKSYTVRAELPDGTSRTKTIGRTISTVGIADIVGGVFFLVPFIGILSPGFWEFRDSDVNFQF